MTSTSTPGSGLGAARLTPVPGNGTLAAQLARVPARLARSFWLETSMWPVVRPSVRAAMLRRAGVKVGSARIVDRIRIIGNDLEIGEGAFINIGCFIEADGGVTIGAHASLGPHVTLITVTHEMGPEICRAAERIQGRITIGVGAWIGANTTVLPGVTIGNGAVVGAGSVVTKDVPDNVVAAGVPARVIREL